MAKKPKDDREHFRPLSDGGTVIPLGNVAVDVARRSAPRIISGAVVDPVILLIRQCFGRYQLEMKLTKKRKKPLSRD